MKKISYYIDAAVISGGSAQGQMHISENIPNQDHYRIKRTKYGIAMAVCDGVGSNLFSHYGSKAASKAVTKVFKLFYKKKVTKEQLGSKIEYYYKKYVREEYKQEASTTCLFAYVYDNSEVIIGQAGDGLILIKLDNRFLTFQDKHDDFVNEVKSLNCKQDYKYWKIRNLRFSFETNHSLAILLCTDGISEDIIPEKRALFFDYFINASRDEKAGVIQQKLDTWTAPGSIDDKTLIIFRWRK